MIVSGGQQMNSAIHTRASALYQTGEVFFNSVIGLSFSWALLLGCELHRCSQFLGGTSWWEKAEISLLPGQLHVCSAAWSCPTPCQALLSVEFSRPESWSGLPFPPPGGHPNPGMNHISCVSCLVRWILYHWATWKPPSQIDSDKSPAG